MSSVAPRGRLLLAAVLAMGLVAGCGGGDESSRSSSTSAAAASPTSKQRPSPSPVGTTAWIVPPDAAATDAEVEAFTATSSVAAGEPLELYVSAAGPVSVAAYRLGDYPGGGTEVYRADRIPAARQQATVTDSATRAVSANWPKTSTVATDGWTPGFYFVQVSAGGKKRNVPLLVRSTDTRGKIVLVAGDTTWQAYNTWGGRSLYKGPGGFEDRAYAASFQRPYSAADWDIWYDFDFPIVMAAEKSGVPLAYAAVSDIADDPGLLEGALGVVSNGHDEYWPIPYRDALVKARDAGTNLAFLGANAGYWRVRLEDSAGARLLVGYKSAVLDPVKDSRETTVRWRDSPEAAGENTVLGNFYDCYPSAGAMRIVTPGFFLFEGTGVARGTELPGLVGNESDRVFAIPGTPRPIEVPAISSVKCGDTTSYSTVAYYTVPSGAGVFAAGTMSWTRALDGVRPDQGLTQASSDFAQKVTANLLTAMAAGPMGRSHPAIDDYDKVAAELPTTNHAN